jgi:glycosyltransferase involved in cell wall biosynthesis
MRPTVSAVIPTQKRQQMLRQAAASVLNQSFADLELIIVLNAATPEATAAAQEIAHRSNVRLVTLDYGSLPAARNAGIAVARGDWVAFLDDDDIWLPNKIERQLQAASTTGADMVNCDFVIDNGSVVQPRGRLSWHRGLSLAESLMLANYGAGGSSGAIVKSSVIRSLGCFDERMRACEDWDMWRRLSWDHHIHYVDEVLLKMRKHEKNMSGRTGFMAMWQFRHFLKMVSDSPPKLRHMLPRAGVMAFFHLVFLFPYMKLCDLTGGRVRDIHWRLTRRHEATGWLPPIHSGDGKGPREGRN